MNPSDEQFERGGRSLNHPPEQNTMIRVDFIDGASSAVPVRRVFANPKLSVASSGPAPGSFDATAILQTAKKQSRLSNPVAVSLARELLKDENYPSDKVLNQLAGFLAGKL